MMTDSTLCCDHCGIHIPEKDLVSVEIDQVSRNFCCHGCHGAYVIITGAGLDNFYSKRNWDTPGIPEHVFDSEYSDEYLEKYVVRNENQAEIILLIEGIRCATCIWLIERFLLRTNGIKDARLNFGTHRLKVTFDTATISPKAILKLISNIGYGVRPYSWNAAQQMVEKENKALLIRFGTAAFFSIQLMGYSFALYAGYFQGINFQTRTIIQALAWAVTTPVVFYSGYPFLSGALKSIRNKTPNMDMLISLGVLTSYFYSIVAFFRHEEVFFDTAAMIVALILLGRLLESSAKNKASSGIDRLLKLTPEMAIRYNKDGSLKQVATAELVPGDCIQIKPGERIPVDGIIKSGHTEIDEAVVSGESMPVERSAGMTVLAGALNLVSVIELEVGKPSAQSFIARIGHMVEDAQSRKAPVQRMADQIAVLFVPVVVVCAIITLYYWTTFTNTHWSSALLYSVSVLVVACPCALGLATPTSILVSTATAASKGILFRGGDIIESTAQVTTAAFDKTGTLTKGKPEVKEIFPVQGNTKDLLTIAAQLEAASSHPLAKGIMQEAHRHNISVKACQTTAIPGKGLACESPQGVMRAGNRQYLIENGVDLRSDPVSNNTEVHIAVGSTYMGSLYLSDTLRPGAASTITSLKKLNILPVMLTGDSSSAAYTLAEHLHIQYESEMTPGDKSEWIVAKINKGGKVLMVGDGINDAPALSSATVGCAMAGGTDIAMETSDIVLTRPDPQKIVEAVKIAQKTLRIIHQNLFWAFFYNILMIPLAVSGNLKPIYAAAAMALSSVFVVFNSLRLSRV